MKSAGQIKYIGFDKDGTLMDSMSSYAKEWGEILYDEFKVNKEEAEEFLLATAGDPTAVQLDTLLRNNNIILPKEEIFSKANRIAFLLGERANAKPFPEVPEVLKKLKEKGYSIFVSSGQQEEIIKRDLKKTNLMQFVDFIAGIRPTDPEFKKGVPHFKAAAKHFGISFKSFVKKAVFVGDTKTDIKVAKESGIRSILRKNKNPEIDFIKLGADYILEDFSNLEETVSSIRI